MKKTGKIQQVGLLEVVRHMATRYGQHVVTNRAIPDLRDGLKPVHRRIIWGMNENPLTLHYKGGTKKAARVVGDVMGKYHPHGDLAIYNALVNLANRNSCVPLVYGEGNWGNHDSNAAAMRYTECKLSAYACKNLLSKDYLAVMQTVPNYDGQYKEPLVLPSRLPTLLLNGSSGIGYGTVTNVPAFKRKGVITLVKMILQGKKITAKDCLKHLQFCHPYGDGNKAGARVVSSKEDILNLFQNGKGRIAFAPIRTLDEKNRSYTITGLPPIFNMETVAIDASQDEEIYSINDESDKHEPIKIVIRLKKTLTKKEVTDAFEALDEYFTRAVPFAINVTIRRGEASKDIEFKREVPISDLLATWVEWRVELEKNVLEYRARVVQGQIDLQHLLRKAYAQIDALYKLVRQRHPSRDVLYEKVAKLLKVTIEDAKTVLGLSLMRLSRLDEDEFENRLKELQSRLKELQRQLKHPDRQVLSWLEKIQP